MAKINHRCIEDEDVNIDFIVDTWWLDLNGQMIEIKFCPFCGKEL